MKLLTENELYKLANQLMKHLAPNCYTGHGLSSFELEDAKSAILFIQQDLLASASEGFEEFCESNTSRYFGLGTFQRELDEKLWQEAKRSQGKEISSLREEVNFLKASNAKLEEARISHLEANEKLQKENEELRKIVSWCRYQLLPYSGYKPDYEKFHEMTKELFKGEAK